MGLDNSLNSTINKTKEVFRTPQPLLKASSLIDENSISLTSIKRCDTFPKLSKLLPQFNTNHREKDGSSSVCDSSQPAFLLDDILKTLSPAQAKSDFIKSTDKVGAYDILQTIGEGSYGKVKLAIHNPTGAKVAVKYLDRSRIKDQGITERILREVVVLSHLAHPNICRLLQVIDTRQEILMFMEYEPGGELFDYLSKTNRLSENIARHFFRQILSAVNYCHAHGVVHRGNIEYF